MYFLATVIAMLMSATVYLWYYYGKEILNGLPYFIVSSVGVVFVGTGMWCILTLLFIPSKFSMSLVLAAFGSMVIGSCIVLGVIRFAMYMEGQDRRKVNQRRQEDFDDFLAHTKKATSEPYVKKIPFGDFLKEPILARSSYAKIDTSFEDLEDVVEEKKEPKTAIRRRTNRDKQLRERMLNKVAGGA